MKARFGGAVVPIVFDPGGLTRLGAHLSRAGLAPGPCALVTDRTNAEQNTFVGQLIDTYLGLPRTNTQCGYACSDHASSLRSMLTST